MRTLLVLVILGLPAHATELHVPSEFSTIQAAVSASTHGDVVTVAPGTYHEAIDFRGRRITLRSSGGAAVTILDGSAHEASILTARSGEALTTVVRGFTFRNGYGDTTPACNLEGRKGGAVFLLNSGMSIVDCVFEENGETDSHAADNIVAGGAIFACQADLFVDRSRFENNGASAGGAIDLIPTLRRQVAIENSTFGGNFGGVGGAIAATLFGGSSLTVIHCTFDRNETAHGGGVTASIRHSAKVTIERSAFTNNEAYGSGGGVHLDLEATSSATVTGCRFDANRASHAAGLLLVTRQDAKASVAGSVFTNGIASFGAGANVNAGDASSIDIMDCDFIGQEASFGAGLYAHASGNLPDVAGGRIRIDGCRFLDNVGHEMPDTGIHIDDCFIDGRPPKGDGLYYGGGADLRTLRGGTVTVANSLFAGNSGVRGGGAHAASCAGGTIDFINCTIVENGLHGLHLRLGRAADASLPGIGMLHVANSIVRDNEGAALAIEQHDPRAMARVTFSNVEGGFTGEGNRDVPPSFVAPEARDYRLAEGSLCIDAGDNTAVPAGSTDDLARRPRFVDDPATSNRGLGTTPPVDIGAYEYQGPKRRRAVRH